MEIEWNGRVHDCSYLCGEVAGNGQNYELLSCDRNGFLLVVKACREYPGAIIEILEEVESEEEFKRLYGFW
jgi:hypothetical protein